MMGRPILIVEDDESIAEGLAYQLRSELFEVFVASTAKEAMNYVMRHDPQLILLDLRLPDGDGFNLCRSFRGAGKTMPILILSALDNESDRVLGLELGADDYITKPYKLREVVARIRSALRRAYGSLAESNHDRSIVFGRVRIDVDAVRIFRDGLPVVVTPAEFRIALLLASNPGKVFSRSRLVEEIYGESRFVTDRSIDVHVHHLRTKIEDDPRKPQWFTTVQGFGYVFGGIH